MLPVAKEKLWNGNFSLPEEVAAEFRRLGDVYGDGNKVRWAVAAAAMLRLLELPDAEIHAMVRDLIGARQMPGEMGKLVRKARERAGSFDTPRLPPVDTPTRRPKR